MFLFESYVCTLLYYTYVTCYTYNNMCDYYCFIHEYLYTHDEKKKVKHDYKCKNEFMLFTKHKSVIFKTK